MLTRDILTRSSAASLSAVSAALDAASAAASSAARVAAASVAAWRAAAASVAVFAAAVASSVRTLGNRADFAAFRKSSALIMAQSSANFHMAPRTDASRLFFSKSTSAGNSVGSQEERESVIVSTLSRVSSSTGVSRARSSSSALSAAARASATWRMILRAATNSAAGTLPSPSLSRSSPVLLRPAKSSSMLTPPDSNTLQRSVSASLVIGAGTVSPMTRSRVSVSRPAAMSSINMRMALLLGPSPGLGWARIFFVFRTNSVVLTTPSPFESSIFRSFVPPTSPLLSTSNTDHRSLTACLSSSTSMVSPISMTSAEGSRSILRLLKS